MFVKLNKTFKKQISLIIIFVIFMSCITMTAFNTDTEIKGFDICEEISDINTADVSFEVLIFQEKTIQNRYRERNLKSDISDKTAVLFAFCPASNTDKSINNTILRSLSNVYSVHDTTLIYIHDKDGKKYLI